MTTSQWPFPTSAHDPDRAVCPKCNGSLRMPCPPNLRAGGELHGWYDYDKQSDTVSCDNCGKQYMYGVPTGIVPRRPDGTPCLHEYVGRSTPSESMRGWHKYRCKHCDDSYEIDSGD